MASSVQVVLIEPDSYSRQWMALLLSRDRRTRVVAQVDKTPRGLAWLDKVGQKIDLVIFGTDGHAKEPQAGELEELLRVINGRSHVLCIGSKPVLSLIQFAAEPGLRGFLLKDEIDHSLAWAATLAAEGNRVITPGIQAGAEALGLAFPRPYLELDGRLPVSNLTEHQAQVARLAFLYSMERRDLADELGLSEEWAYGLVSGLYEKLGLKDLLSDDQVDPSGYLGTHPLILSHFKKIRADFQGSGKSRDMETLAFHLLTLPDIQTRA